MLLGDIVIVNKLPGEQKTGGPHVMFDRAKNSVLGHDIGGRYSLLSPF
jgi:hypothetical protein